MKTSNIATEYSIMTPQGLFTTVTEGYIKNKITCIRSSISRGTGVLLKRRTIIPYRSRVYQAIITNWKSSLPQGQSYLKLFTLYWRTPHVSDSAAETTTPLKENRKPHSGRRLHVCNKYFYT